MEKNAFRFLQSFFQILTQCALTLIFMSHYGVMAIAGAKMLCVSVASVGGILYVIYGLGMAKSIPLPYIGAVFTGAVMTVAHTWLMPSGWLVETALTLSCIALFIIVSRLSWHEIRGIIRFLRYRDVGVLTTLAENNQHDGTIEK